MSNISSVIKSIQDIMRQDSGVDGDAQRISQLTWLLFLKVFDALEEELELTRDDYKSPIPEAMRWRNWATDAEGITGDALLDFVNNQLFATLKSLSGDAQRNPRGYVVRGVFEDAYNYMKSGQLLRQVINKLNAIDFNRQAERHQFNDLYEKILKDLQSAGNAGEFYTPRAVTQFMVDMVNPQLGERVMDPATGTGGFLVCAIEHLRKQVHNTDEEATLQNSILGVEKKQMPHMLCVTNLMLHGIEVPSLVRHDNTLSRPLRDYSPADRVDVILTNPPFGGIEEPGKTPPTNPPASSCKKSAPKKTTSFPKARSNATNPFYPSLTKKNRSSCRRGGSGCEWGRLSTPVKLAGVRLASDHHAR